jgi:2-C-methyl-D-erythritol 4-phosphate cytidylyltransferase/2-C-methyl-D-erythritol 2,4-cyclodiphosphate synthase
MACQAFPGRLFSKRRPPLKDRIGAVIAAGGRGLRFSGPGSLPKQLWPLSGKPIFLRSLEALIGCGMISEFVVVAPEDLLDAFRMHLKALEPGGGNVSVIPGGGARAESVLLGMKALGPGVGWILVHDAARPLLLKEDAVKVIDEAKRSGAAILAAPLSDTLKRAEAAGGGGDAIQETIPREGLWTAMTPQVFKRDLLERAYRGWPSLDATDEASMVEALGVKVSLVQGDPRNIKVTGRADLETAEALFKAIWGGGGLSPQTPASGAAGLAGQAASSAPASPPPSPEPSSSPPPSAATAAASPPKLSIGQGWDFHRFDPSRSLWLGCVLFEGEPGLAGHSDADVLAHALIDALLWAASLDAIGALFPDSDERWRGATGRGLLELAWGRCSKEFSIVHIDLTLFGERPRISGRRLEMRQALAGILGVPAGMVNLKGKTTEGMGFLGRGEGLAAQAVALLERK